MSENLNGFITQQKEKKKKYNNNSNRRSMKLEKKYGDKTIQLVKDDITKRKVDVIVNAANSNLKHYGGVAAAIVQNGGRVIQEESDKIEFIPAGQVAMTGSGNLPSKAILHAVGPQMGEGDEDNKLQNAVFNSLKIASKNNFHSISFPAISSGIFGFPKDRCAKIMLGCLKDYLLANPDSSLIRLEICLFDDDTFQYFKKEFANL